MIISDGTTDIELEGTTIDELKTEGSQSVTAGGLLRSQTSGIRPEFEESPVRITQTEMRALASLLTNGANYYYYTPSQTPAWDSGSDFPMVATFEIGNRIDSAWNGTEVVHYYSIKIRSVSYL